MSRRLQDADAGYVYLAYAILVQAISDAVAPLCTWRTDAVPPSAADVRSAREFLASPAAHWLAAQLGLSLKRIRQQMDDLAHRAEPGQWMDLREAARCLGCHPEYLRRLIHRGQVTARRGRSGRWLVARRVVVAYQRAHPDRIPTPPR